MAGRKNNHGELDERILALLALRVPMTVAQLAKALWLSEGTVYPIVHRLVSSRRVRGAGRDVHRIGKGGRAVAYTLA